MLVWKSIDSLGSALDPLFRFTYEVSRGYCILPVNSKVFLVFLVPEFCYYHLLIAVLKQVIH